MLSTVIKAADFSSAVFPCFTNVIIPLFLPRLIFYTLFKQYVYLSLLNIVLYVFYDVYVFLQIALLFFISAYLTSVI